MDVHERNYFKFAMDTLLWLILTGGLNEKAITEMARYLWRHLLSDLELEWNPLGSGNFGKVFEVSYLSYY